jgi:hypothetical protein
VRRSSANAPHRAGTAPTEGGGEHSVEKSADPFELQHLERPRRTARPGTRTRVDDLPQDAGGHAGRRCVVTATTELHAPSGWMSVSHPHAHAYVASSMRRLSATRPRRGRGAMEGGDEGDEHGGVKSGHSFERQAPNARGERRDQGPHEPHCPRGLDVRFACSRLRRPATTRRSSMNAAHSAGASQWKAR